MKPKIFIGSSVESLSIAYFIQQNLEHDANVTVWNQGVFQLSSTALDDLLKSLNEFDYGIFVFNADDVGKIRNTEVSIVRDNVIFELGLFLGKLGKEKVFYLLPRGEKSLRLPSDLLGVNAGTYDNKREDGNLQAALGPFCNQVRLKIKDFIYESLNDLKDESSTVKRIAVEKPEYWEYLLICELLEPKLKKINEDYLELEKGLFFKKATRYSTFGEFTKWFYECLEDIQRLISVFSLIINEEIQAAVGPPGIAGNVLEIKKVCDKVVMVGKELLNWEYKVSSSLLPEEFEKIPEYMAGWSKPIFKFLYLFPSEVKRIVKEHSEGKKEIQKIYMKLDSLEHLDEIKNWIIAYHQKIIG